MNRRVTNGLIVLLGGCLLLAGVVRLTHSGLAWGVDFKVFYHAALRYTHGHDPYLEQGSALQLPQAIRGEIKPLVLSWYLYPPLTSAILAPLALFNFPNAKAVWCVFLLATLLVGIWRALSVIAPQWPASARLLLLGLSTHAASIYWLALQLQITMFIVGLLGLVLYAERSGRDRLLLVTGVLATCKPTFFLPVFCLLAFRERWRMLGAILAATLALNLLCALPTGWRETYAGYRIAMANAQAPGTNNYPDANETMRSMRFLPPRPIETTPGTRYPFTVGAVGEHLSWPYLFSALTRDLARAKTLSLLCTALSLTALVALWWRSRPLHADPEFLLRLYAVSICLSLLCIYHLRYDSSALIYPFFISLALASRRVTADTLATALLSFLLAFAFTTGVTRFLFLHFVMYSVRVWLVPYRSYGITLTFLIALWGTWRYALQTGAESERVHSPESSLRRAG
ncbi:MAG TPA: glycosyltransferase family 87 protein [Chthonomonadaceae bacterium]|nr:glycosyltransferase family 87 protein [Chthonomonadaceae bacterium]